MRHLEKYLVGFFFFFLFFKSDFGYSQDSLQRGDAQELTSGAADDMQADISIKLSKLFPENAPTVFENQTTSELRKIDLPVDDYGKELIFHYNMAREAELDGRYSVAKEALQRALSLCTKKKDLENQALIIRKMGDIHRFIGDSEAAMRNYLEAAGIIEKLKDTVRLVTINISIGKVFDINRVMEKVLEHNERALTLAKTIDDTASISNALIAYANYYSRLKQDQQVVEFSAEAIDLARKVGDMDIQARALFISGMGYSGLAIKSREHYQKAEEDLLEAMVLFRQLGRKRTAIMCFTQLALIQYNQGNYDKALQFSLEGLEAAKEFGGNLLLSNYLMLFYAYGGVEDGENVFKYAELYRVLKDSLKNEETAQTILKLEAKYESEKKDRKIALLAKEKELETWRFRFSVILYLGISFLLFVFVFFWYRRKKTRYEDELNKLRALKVEFESERSEEKITRIPINAGNKISLFDPKNVIFFYSENRHVFLVDSKGEVHIIDYTLKHLEKTLPSNFVRVHNSYIINKNEIASITKSYNGKVIFTMNHIEKTKIPSGVKYAESVKELQKLE